MKSAYKNLFHIEPAVGLLNDPNGLIQFKGKYYFFHQWNRFETTHDYKEWGLFTSSDLLDWQAHGSAVLPDQVNDKDGIYSGSAVEKDGQLYLFYTGNSKEEDQRKSRQRIAYSKDGRTFIKSDTVIETPLGLTEHHRDPKVWAHDGKWWMIVGAQTENNEGAISLFESGNLIDWTYQGLFFTDPLLEQMCECPDTFHLAEGVDLLLVCPQKRTPVTEDDLALGSYSGYLVGKIDYQNKKFLPKEAQSLQLLDQGFDFYAPQSFIDEKGRRILVAWMSRMTDEEEQQCPTIEEGYVHCLTLPRELKWQENRLYQVPLEEYQQLRKKQAAYHQQSAVIKNSQPIYELLVKFDNQTAPFTLTFNAGGNQLRYQEGQLEISRINWVSGENEMKKFAIDQLTSLQIFNDGSAVEVFINEGQYVFSMRNFCNYSTRDITYENLGHNGSIMFYTY
ncbi:sucrase [Enterococcus sp. JM4C]|uniref:glycoside hydrolase family 32 protein n=1 Tax=Candidatus Enterococcus huntleyi TaxID=1857217 RepID=UPI00137B09E6|nr:glycoside hydrolase family 32 protein [Enterococcus sp. JM4C]KAF1299430.1 sucrase [Enterococcus sp. JM4C]